MKFNVGPAVYRRPSLGESKQGSKGAGKPPTPLKLQNQYRLLPVPARGALTSRGKPPAGLENAGKPRIRPVHADAAPVTGDGIRCDKTRRGRQELVVNATKKSQARHKPYVIKAEAKNPAIKNRRHENAEMQKEKVFDSPSGRTALA